MISFDGFITGAPDPQKNPSAQSPVGVEDPVKQYFPVGQAAQSAAAIKLVLSLYVPAGQGNRLVPYAPSPLFAIKGQ
jgi:hypothetical protein